MLADFLRRSSAAARAALRGDAGAGAGADGASVAAPLTVVLGNEAADADSVVSAVALAFLLRDNVVPLVSCRRDEFRLRSETVWLLDTAAAVSADDLLFLDDVPLPECGTDNIRLTLVDHNQLCGALEPLDAAVTSIVDHHKDVGAHKVWLVWVEKRSKGVCGGGGRCRFSFHHSPDAVSCLRTARRRRGALHFF